MKSIVFIIPYFGHFNNYFEIWLNSCAHNPTIDWLIFTDCKDEYDYPRNVKVVYTTFDEIRARFQSFYNFTISLEKPYKLCDFKPAYGEVFYDYIKDYDFWGYCDTDLIWGDIRKFMNNDVLEKYDKIGIWGHCCLVRNTAQFRTLYRAENTNIVTYKSAFASELAYCFDEKRAFGKICVTKGVKIFDNYTFFDIDYRHDDYRISALDDDYIRKFATGDHNIFKYNDGKLYLLTVESGANEIQCRELSYVHFQKRNMAVNISNKDYDKFLIYQDKFMIYRHVASADEIKRLDPKSWKSRIYLKVMWNKIRAEYLHGEGVRYYKYNYD